MAGTYTQCAEACEKYIHWTEAQRANGFAAHARGTLLPVPGAAILRHATCGEGIHRLPQQVHLNMQQQETLSDTMQELSVSHSAAAEAALATQGHESGVSIGGSRGDGSSPTNHGYYDDDDDDDECSKPRRATALKQQQHEADCIGPEPFVYRPPQASRELCYDQCARLRYRSRGANEKTGIVHCSNINMLVNNVAFLTEKSLPGDVVVYVGCTLGSFLVQVAKMFPRLHFVVYDVNPTSVHYRNAKEIHPPNIQLISRRFTDQDARSYSHRTTVVNSSSDCGSAEKMLLIVNCRHVTKSVCHQPDDDEEEGLSTKGRKAKIRCCVTQDNVLQDMHDQERWVHLMRPRSAMLRFRLPFQGWLVSRFRKNKSPRIKRT